ncbi:MAG: DGQHR domain-containing protein, partial [Nitrososphaeraceae archaeon]|nr:DGQHR domain-containing protein [Nitrososphaeraceae archaeon]
MPGKGYDLNNRVWKIFEKAGFETEPNTKNLAEHESFLTGSKKRPLDLYAEDKSLSVKIIGSNKSGDIKGPFSGHVNDMVTIQKTESANGLLFVIPKKEIRSEDRDYLEKVGARLWQRSELEYFETLVNTIGPYAKYEIIKYFSINTNEQSSMHNVLALKMNQPVKDSQYDLFLFTLTPEILLKTCSVLRRSQGIKYAYQRVLQKKRLSNIGRFVSQSESLLPTNIIVSFENSIIWHDLSLPQEFPDGKNITYANKDKYQLVILSIPLTYSSLELIDGQHRLFGFIHAPDNVIKDFNLVVLGINNINSDKRTETFIAINDKARRVDPNLVAYLKYTDDESKCQNDNELMAIKVVCELNKSGTLRDKIRILDIGNEIITLKGFAGYDLKGLLGK